MAERKNRQLISNIAGMIAIYVMNTLISFFLTPYIVEHLGTVANGYVTLANNFVEYAQLFTVALSSVAVKYIVVEIHKNRQEQANLYYNSALGAIFLLGTGMLFLGTLMVVFLEKLIRIPAGMEIGVKVLFELIFINFYLSLFANIFTVGTFSSNRIEKEAMTRIAALLLKALVLVAGMRIFGANIILVGVAVCCMGAFTLLCNVYYKERFTSQLKIRRSCFRTQLVKEMISSGIWNSLSQAGQILISGMDLLICNLWIGTEEMGLLSIPKQFAVIILGVISAVAYVFNPRTALYYSKGEINKAAEELKLGMKITGCVSALILSAFLVYGKPFLKLWIPSQDITVIYRLSLLSLLYLTVQGVCSPLFYIYTLTNRLKWNSFVEIGIGIANIAIVFFLLKVSSLGVYAVAGVSSVLGFIKHLIYTPIYASRCLRLKKSTFYPVIARCLAAQALLALIFYGITRILPPVSWAKLFAGGILGGVPAAAVAGILMFGKEGREFLRKMSRAK